MNWTEIYQHAVYGDILLIKSNPPEGVLDLKACRPIPCPGSYFPAHDEACEMEWQEDETGWGWFTDCDCEPRARERRDAGQV